MGNGGSHGQPGGAVAAAAVSRHQPPHWHHSLPSDPVLKASHLKVLPDLDQNPRLRSTNNGAILHSGGTISGRRPLSLALPHDRDPMHHNGVHRSKSISQDPYEGERQQRFSYLSNQRDPLHRSHTHLHLEEPEESFASQSKRFGSEPDLRSSQEIQSKNKVSSKNLKKKYKAPPPPQYQDNNGGSSPDSWKNQQSYDHQPPQPPSRKLRLFKTRAETKKNLKHNHDVKSNGYIHHTQEHMRPYEIEDNRQYPNDIFEQSRYIEREKLIRSPSREREEYLKYPSNREDDMVQTQSSLKREENILQTAFSRQEFIRTKNSQQNMYREKSKAIESRFESNRGFRNSERFKKQDTDTFVMRREKSFDTSLMQESSHNSSGVNRMHNDRKSLLENQHKFNNRDDPLIDERQKERNVEKSAISNRKSAPAGGLPSAIGSLDFQAELKMATRKLRNVSKPIPPRETKVEKKVITSKVDSGLKDKITSDKVTTKPLNRVEERNIRNTDSRTNGVKNPTNQNKSNIVTLDRSKQTKPKAPRVVREEKKEEIKAGVKAIGTKVLPVDKVAKENIRNRRESRVLADRGQASGKESTPEQSPSRVKAETTWDRNQQNQPCKSFYFGMDKSNNVPAAEEEVNVHEKVRRHLEMNYKEFSKTNAYPADDKVIQNTPKNDYNTKLELPQGSSESALSSEPEQDDPMSVENNPHGIALQLRPTLPKKQLEIPRFSPAAAWRLLAAMEAENESGTGSEVITPRLDQPQAPHLEEERIRRLSRPRPARSTHDKSGDSGISGDAGPGNDDCIEAAIGPSSAIITLNEPSSRPLLTAWTPQQDLEEESSSDAGVDSPHSANIDNAPAKFSARQQVFSLSLPRETHLAHLGEKNKQFQQPFNSLQKFKKSVSGALGVALGAKKLDAEIEEISDEQADNNWFLSRSAPNSLNNGMNSNLKLSAAKSNDSGQQQTPPSSDQEDDRLPPVLPNIMRQQPPFSYLATGGHVMYLPQYDSQRSTAPVHGQGLSLPLHDQPYSMSYADAGKEKERLHHHHHHQYQDDIMERRSDGEIEEIDAADKDKYKGFKDGRMMMSRSKSSGEIITSSRVLATKPRVKGKRFTFQSTVRQIERRRLAEKLSREAETKERQRLSELEAMRRVEEEFQRKRAREKASIRQQLRLVSLDESCSSLPSSWGQGRAEPEGAVSPSPPPASGSASGSGSGSGSAASGGRASNSSLEGAPRAPATRVLSEYRQATREYRDYRRAPQAPTIHPPACYNMPRAPTSASRTGGGGSGGWATTSDAANDSDNYRKEFARGRRAPSSSGSDLSQGGRGRLVTPPRSSENYLNDDLHEKFSTSLPRRDRGTMPLFQCSN